MAKQKTQDGDAVNLYYMDRHEGPIMRSLRRDVADTTDSGLVTIAHFRDISRYLVGGHFEGMLRRPVWRHGAKRRMTLHVINGTPDEIKARLLESVDAFFEIYAAPDHSEQHVARLKEELFVNRNFFLKRAEAQIDF